MFAKHKITLICAFFICVAFFVLWHTKQPGTSVAVRELTRSEKDAIIEQALTVNLPTSSTIISDEALWYRAQAINKVQAAKYEEAIEVVLSGLQKEYDSFTLQAILAALIGDTSEITKEPLKSRMLQRAKELFEVLLLNAKRQPKEAFYMFQNEYNYRNALYKEQYENGIECVGHYWNSPQWDPYGIKGYYYQGVGAANYAKMLLQKRSKSAGL